ncbi:MAG: hypothetical protein WAP16_03890 [Flavobacteriaceae bacterium]
MKNIFFTLLSLLTLSMSAQMNETDQAIEKSKTFSIGVKVGVPNIISINGEFVLPVLNNRFAPYVDYGSFGLDIEDTETTIKYIEYGLNIYMGKKGKGLYVGAGSGTLKNEFTFNNLTFEENGVSLQGSATLKIGL